MGDFSISPPMAGAPTPAHPATRWIFSVLVVNFHPFWNQSFAGLDPYFQLLRSSSAVCLPLGLVTDTCFNFSQLHLCLIGKRQKFLKSFGVFLGRISLLLHLYVSGAEVESRNKPNLLFSVILVSVALQLQVNQGFPQLWRRRKGFSIH